MDFEKVVQDLRNCGVFYSGSYEGLDGIASFLMENYAEGLSMLEAVKYMPEEVRSIMLRSFQEAAWPGHSTADSLEWQWKYDPTNLCYYQEEASAESNSITRVTFYEVDVDRETTYFVQAGPREAKVLVNISYVRHETEHIPFMFKSDHYDRLVSTDASIVPDYLLTVTIKDTGRGHTKLFRIVDLNGSSNRPAGNPGSSSQPVRPAAAPAPAPAARSNQTANVPGHVTGAGNNNGGGTTTTTRAAVPRQAAPVPASQSFESPHLATEQQREGLSRLANRLNLGSQGLAKKVQELYDKPISRITQLEAKELITALNTSLSKA